VDAGKSKKQLTKNIFSLTVVQIATYVLPLISVPVISRIIGPGKYGIINFAAAYIVYFNLLISYSFDFTATRKIARDPDNEENRNVVFSEVFYTQCLLFVFAAIVFIILLYIVPELRANKTIVVYSFFVCVAALFTQNWLFQAMQDLSKVALFNMISRLLFTISILIVVRKNDDYIWQPFLIGVIQTGVAIWSFIWAFKKYKIKWVKISLMRCWLVLWEDRIMFFSLVVVNLYTTTNIFILGLYQNSKEVGFYTAGQRLIVIVQSILTMPFSQAFYPFIGKAFGNNRSDGIVIVQKLIPLIMVFTGMAVICILLFGHYVIRLFYGNSFEPASTVFKILAFIPLISALSNILGIHVMLNLGMDKYFFRITACGAVISVVMNILTIRRWGYLETAANWLITEIFILASMFFVLRMKGIHTINLKYFKQNLLREYVINFKGKYFKN